MRSPIPASIARFDAVFLAAIGIALAGAVPASAQQLAGWAGSIRCELQAQAPGYTHQETQTWTLTGAPTMQGSVTAYPATWTVVGGGQHDRITGTSTRRVAQWTANVAGVTAPIGFTQHALGRTFDVSKWHAQLTRGGGYTGTDQFFNNGVPSSSQQLVATVYEWQFPKIEAATTETQLSGTNTTQVKAFIGPLQPFEAVATVTCTWSLARGSAPPSLPPSTMPPANTTSGGTTPAATTPAATTPATTTPATTTPAATTPAATTPTATTPAATTPAATTPTATTPAATTPGSTVPGGTAPAPPVTPGPVWVSLGSSGHVDLQFGQVEVGSTSPQLSVRLGNTDGGQLGPINIVGGGPSGAFGASQNCQGRTLNPGQSCDMSYTFTPTTAGSTTGASDFVVTYTPDGSYGRKISVSLNGTGIAAIGRPSAGGPAIVTGVPGSVLTKDAPTSDLWTVINGVTGRTKGQPFVFESRVRNLGSIPVTGTTYTVTMTPLSGVSITQMTCTANNGAIPCPTLGQLANGFATPTLMPGGADFRIYIHGTWTADVGSSVTFAVTGRAPAGVYDPDSNNNSESWTVVVGGP